MIYWPPFISFPFLLIQCTQFDRYLSHNMDFDWEVTEIPQVQYRRQKLALKNSFRYVSRSPKISWAFDHSAFIMVRIVTFFSEVIDTSYITLCIESMRLQIAMIVFIRIFHDTKWPSILLTISHFFQHLIQLFTSRLLILLYRDIPKCLTCYLKASPCCFFRERLFSALKGNAKWTDALKILFVNKTVGF